MLPDPVARDGKRPSASGGLLGEGADPVFATGAGYPLAGLLLAPARRGGHRASGGRPGRLTHALPGAHRLLPAFSAGSRQAHR